VADKDFFGIKYDNICVAILAKFLKAPQIYRPHGLEAKLIVTRVLELL
jgi:hypothetical protein